MSNDDLSPHIKEQIDRGLRHVFERQMEAELPEHLQDLIARLGQTIEKDEGGSS